MTGLVLHSSVKMGLLYQQESEFAANTFRGVLGNFVWSTVYIPPLNVQILWRIVLGAKSEKSKYLAFDNSDAWYVLCMWMYVFFLLHFQKALGVGGVRMGEGVCVVYLLKDLFSCFYVFGMLSACTLFLP